MRNNRSELIAQRGLTYQTPRPINAQPRRRRGSQGGLVHAWLRVFREMFA